VVKRGKHEVLIVEADDEVRTFLADNLTADGFEVYAASGIPGGLAKLSTKMIDLAVVDLNGSSMEFVDEVAGQVMMLVLGASTDLERVRMLEHGADDVMSKPFNYLELRGRINAILRRAQTKMGRQVSEIAGVLRIDLAARRVFLHGEPIELSNKEFGLLRALASEPARVFTKDDLLRQVWGNEMTMRMTRTLDSHCCRLRRKLNAHGDTFLVNVWGVGYRLLDEGPLA
jgi:DNA-binding response OmpR family regulator